MVKRIIIGSIRLFFSSKLTHGHDTRPGLHPAAPQHWFGRVRRYAAELKPTSYCGWIGKPIIFDCSLSSRERLRRERWRRKMPLPGRVVAAPPGVHGFDANSVLNRGQTIIRNDKIDTVAIDRNLTKNDSFGSSALWLSTSG
jgi:hypothetical protein